MLNTIYPAYLYSSEYYDLFAEKDTNYFMSNLSTLLAKEINSVCVCVCLCEEKSNVRSETSNANLWFNCLEKIRQREKN